MPPQRVPTDPKQPSNPYLRFGGFAFQLLGGIGLAAWLGHRLDAYMDLHFPVFMLLFILVMLTGMLYQIFKTFNRE